MVKMNSQVTELVGRNYLTAQILSAGLEVALPMRDRGTDLIIYRDLPGGDTSFQCLPLQMKVATTECFAVDQKYAKFPGLILVYVWNVGSASEDHPTYAMTYADALLIAEKMGWTKTATWRAKKLYTMTKPSLELKGLLDPFRMSPERWRTVFAMFSRGAG